MSARNESIDNLMPVRLVEGTEQIVERLIDAVGEDHVIFADGQLVQPLAPLGYLHKTRSGDPEARQIQTALADGGYDTPVRMNFGSSYSQRNSYGSNNAYVNLVTPDLEPRRQEADIINDYLKRHHHYLKRMSMDPCIKAAYGLTSEQVKNVVQLTSFALRGEVWLSKPVTRQIVYREPQTATSHR